jgi:hypothetical protein
MLLARLSKQKIKLIVQALRQTHSAQWSVRSDGYFVVGYDETEKSPDLDSLCDGLEQGAFRTAPLSGEQADLIVDALEWYNILTVDNVTSRWSQDMQALAAELKGLKSKAQG